MTSVSEFSNTDRELIAALSARLTGSNQQAQLKIDSCLVNVRRRIEMTQAANLREYLSLAATSVEELAQLISAITIHTTSWFRERPHFDRLYHFALTAAATFQAGKRTAPLQILSAGCSSGEEAYSIALVLEEVRRRFPSFDYRIQGWDVDRLSIDRAARAIFALASKKDIPTEFHPHLLNGSGPTAGLFTLSKDIRDHCQFLCRSLVVDLAHATERFDAIFCRNVLIYFSLDDMQNIVRQLVTMLHKDGILFLGHSESVHATLFNLAALGNTAYRKLATPPQSESAGSRESNLTLSLRRPDLILVAASTGGTEVLVSMLHNLPKPCPPVLVVQHISSAFARSFAERLAVSAGLTLGVPQKTTPILPNHLYMALGDYHIVVRGRRDYLFLDISHQALVHGVRPSADILLRSAVEIAKHGTVAAIILTGMGKDGAAGLAELRKYGANTYAQDEKSSVVFGMARAAIALGGAEFIGNPSAIRQRLLSSLKGDRGKAEKKSA